MESDFDIPFTQDWFDETSFKRGRTSYDIRKPNKFKLEYSTNYCQNTNSIKPLEKSGEAILAVRKKPHGQYLIFMLKSLPRAKNLGNYWEVWSKKDHNDSNWMPTNSSVGLIWFFKQWMAWVVICSLFVSIYKWLSLVICIITLSYCSSQLCDIKPSNLSYSNCIVWKSSSQITMSLV